jgi:hypothetical protein
MKVKTEIEKIEPKNKYAIKVFAKNNQSLNSTTTTTTTTKVK